MEVKDVYPEPLPDFEVELKYDYVHQLIGKVIPAEVVKSIVTSLEMKIEHEDAEGLRLMVPAYRVDVKRPCDVVEDILRIYGYNNVEIPTQLKSSLVVKGEDDERHVLENLIGEQLVGCGFNEILNNSLTKAAYYDEEDKNLVRIVNPLSSDLSVMRATLLYGGLESIAYNANRKSPNLRFFEFGNVYKYTPEKADANNPMNAYSEENHLALWITGKRVEGSWAHGDEQSSFHELKAYVVNVLRRIGLNFGNVVWKEYEGQMFSKALTIENRGGKVFGQMGIVDRKILKQADIAGEVYYAELNWTQLMKAVRKNKVLFTEISKYPAVSRDLALLIDKDVEFASIEQIAYQSERKLLKKVELFDVYEGKNLPQGKKSYAVNFILQDEQKTLNDKQIDAIMQKIIGNLKKQLNAELR